MKIVYCTMSMGVGGGVERILTAKINRLVDLGHEVKVVITDYHGEKLVPAYGLYPEVEIIHYPINFTHDFSYPIWTRAYRTLKKWKRYYKLLKEFLFDYRPDIVCTTQPLDTAFLPFIKDGSKKVLEFHSSKLQYRLNRKTTKNSIKNFLFSTYELRDYLISKSYDKVVVLTNKDLILRGLSNGIVIPNFSNMILSLSFQKHKNTILALGRFTEEKDFSSLISIWSKIAYRHPSWKLCIVGEGYLLQSLSDQVLNLGLNNQVEILPHRHDVTSLYQEASIYAMTSRFEGLPMVLLEAQSAKLPIVSYDCPCGPSDIITDGLDGYLIPPGDEELFAHKLEKLITDTTLRTKMGQQALESAQKFAPNKVMKMWIELFSKLTSKS